MHRLIASFTNAYNLPTDKFLSSSGPDYLINIAIPCFPPYTDRIYLLCIFFKLFDFKNSRKSSHLSLSFLYSNYSSSKSLVYFFSSKKRTILNSFFEFSYYGYKLSSSSIILSYFLFFAHGTI